MHDDHRRPLPWRALTTAASLHVGAASAAASLRHDLVEEPRPGAPAVSAALFDRFFSLSRLTPGTNQLALYVLLGRHFQGWKGALQALAVGAAIPGLVACAAGAVYVRFFQHPFVESALRGARAGALAILFYAIVRLLRSQLQQHRMRGVWVFGASLALGLTQALPQVVLLIAAGIVGALVLRTEP